MINKLNSTDESVLSRVKIQREGECYIEIIYYKEEADQEIC